MQTGFTAQGYQVVVPRNLLYEAGTTVRALLGSCEGTLQAYQALLSSTCPARVSQGGGTVTGELQGRVLCETLRCLLVRERQRHAAHEWERRTGG